MSGDESVAWGTPATSTRAVREYLTALDENSSTDILPKSISPIDPAARLTARREVRLFTPIRPIT